MDLLRYSGEDPDPASRFRTSAPHGDTLVHMGNEGRRGFSGANPPNPSGKWNNTEASVLGSPTGFVPSLTPRSNLFDSNNVDAGRHRGEFCSDSSRRRLRRSSGLFETMRSVTRCSGKKGLLLLVCKSEQPGNSQAPKATF